MPVSMFVIYRTIFIVFGSHKWASENSIKLSEREKKFLLCLNKVDIDSINRLKFREFDILTLIEIFEKFIMINIDEKLKIKYFLREDF